MKYKFIKDSRLERPKNVSREDFISASYGQEYTYEPKDIPLRVYHFSGSVTGSSEYTLIRSLKNTINYYSALDDLYNFDNFYNKPIALYSFNSLHLGSGIQKGSVNLSTYLSGNLLSSAKDFREDGILYTENDEKVGIVLYREGFIILNNTSSLSNDVVNFSSAYDSFQDNPRWIYSFLSASESLFFDIDYNVKSSIATNLNFVYAEKNKLNHSNNPTYIESGSYYHTSGSYFFKENEYTEIKNIVKSPFVSGSASFEKETYITRIGLYDQNKKLIAAGNLANPVRKTENREFTFKLKIDL